MHCRNPRDQSGFTLIEVLVAAFVLVVGVLATLTLINGANRATAATQSREAGVNLARELVEAARGVTYDKLADTSIDAQLQAVPGLQDSPLGGVYQIRRRGVDYTVDASVCIMDDAKDGGGSRPSGLSFCADSGPAGTTDKNPEDYKRVTVTLTWKRGGVTRTATETGLVNNPGSATGPAVRSIIVPGKLAPYEITTADATVPLRLTTSSKPATINWTVDGSVQPTPLVSDTTGLIWDVNWNVSTLDDGPYLISGEAFNRYGVSGPTRTETVTLNRNYARPPSRVAGGRTKFGTVEIEWAANTERDIVGYEVRRVSDGAIVCPLATQKLDTLCTDTSPPTGDPLTYEVWSYDKAPVTGAPRSSQTPTLLTVATGNTPPFAPTVISATTTGGVVTIKWKRPSPEDPDPGDGVEFYRVYRDGVLLANRYDRWYDPNSTVTWTDTATGGLPHTYAITAVDKSYLESGFAMAVPVP